MLLNPNPDDFQQMFKKHNKYILKFTIEKLLARIKCKTISTMGMFTHFIL